MNENATNTQSVYNKLGVSTEKEDVERALEKTKIEELYSGSFCKILSDPQESDYALCLHEDGAGSKSIQAYIHWKETGDASVFRGIAQDATVMNTDDMLCIGATNFVIADTIARNSKNVSGDVISEVIAGFSELCKKMSTSKTPVSFAGGETADLNDQTGTIIVDATAFSRMKKENVINGFEVAPGDLIVGISSSGKATYEDCENSGIGSNGLTLARNCLMKRDYLSKYPEISCQDRSNTALYSGRFAFDDFEDSLDMTVGEAILSPTRTYLPILSETLDKMRPEISAFVHVTGGGQSKTAKVGKGIEYVKNNLFEPSPIFKLIQQESGESWRDMHRDFNMGHRMEVIVKTSDAVEQLVSLCEKFNIEAKQIRFCRKSETGKNKVVVESQFGKFEYE